MTIRVRYKGIGLILLLILLLTLVLPYSVNAAEDRGFFSSAWCFVKTTFGGSCPAIHKPVVVNIPDTPKPTFKIKGDEPTVLGTSTETETTSSLDNSVSVDIFNLEQKVALLESQFNNLDPIQFNINPVRDRVVSSGRGSDYTIIPDEDTQTEVGVLNQGSITEGFGNINIGDSSLTAGSLDIDSAAITTFTSTSTFIGGMNSTISSPSVVATDYITGINYMASKGDYIFAVGNGDNFYVIDITNRTDPEVVYTLADDGTTYLTNAATILIIGDIAYVTAENGIQLIDISDPLSPVAIDRIVDSGSIPLSGSFDLVHSGKYLYVSARSEDKILIFDISDNRNPVLINTIDDDSSTIFLDDVRGIDVQGNILAASSYRDDSVQLFDVSDPYNPVVKDVYFDTDDDVAVMDGATDVVIKDNYMFVVSYSDRGVEILNITDPDSITSIDRKSQGWADFGNLDRVMLYGDTLVFSHGIWNSNVIIMDISNPYDVSRTYVYYGGSTGTSWGTESHIIKDGYLYYALSRSDGIFGVNPHPTFRVVDLKKNRIQTLANDYLYGGEIEAHHLDIKEVSTDSIVVNRGLVAYGPSSFYSRSTSTASLTLTASSTTGTVLDMNVGTTNLATFTGTGYLGIGTSTPATQLHVYRATDGAPVRFEDSNGYCEIDPTTTTWTCTSDERLKENIASINASSTLESFKKLNPVNFNWISDETDTTRTGLIAQEVEEEFPDLVRSDKDTGLKSVAYGGFIPYIISVVQKIDDKVDSIAAEMSGFGKKLVSNVSSLFADRVVVKDELCFDNVCVKKWEFKKMMEMAGVEGTKYYNGTTDPPEISTSTDDIATSTEDVATSTEKTATSTVTTEEDDLVATTTATTTEEVEEQATSTPDTVEIATSTDEVSTTTEESVEEPEPVEEVEDVEPVEEATVDEEEVVETEE